MSLIIGALIEAWDELRIHRGRVLLSLIGVGVAVCALTSVVGFGGIAQQAQVESLERGSGRPATLVLNAPYNSETGQQAPQAQFLTAVDRIVERYRITYSGTVSWFPLSVQFVDGVSAVDSAQAVDVDYGVMHRVALGQGRWFTAADEQLLAPPMVVNNAFWQRLGAPDLRTHPTATIVTNSGPVTAVIVGVTPAPAWDEGLQVYVLQQSLPTLMAGTDPTQVSAQVELWVPTDLAEPLVELIRRDLGAALGEGWTADVSRTDYLAWQGSSDPLGPIRLVLTGVAVVILLLGALSLLNISLVTVRQRVREIGVRRSFGATAGRVFFAVMMESVVATVFAGIVGIFAAVVIVSGPWTKQLINVTDMPPFPVEAALVGLAAATAVGALAGLVPALVAVRVKVIDAIRF